MARAAAFAASWFAVAACTRVSYPGPLYPVPGQGVTPAFLNAAAGSGGCDRPDIPVTREVFPERVVFATASDQPAPGAAELLDMLASRMRRDATGTELTVLGHTDAEGSDAYNMDLSKRRALSVLRGLAARGIDPGHLSAVAIGKRQPAAENATAAGRARNRRVEFLISGCLAANLNAVRAAASSDDVARSLVDVLRLEPSAASGLAAIGKVSLQRPQGDRTTPATAAPQMFGRAPVPQPPAGVAKPAPAPHYQPRTLTPEAQHNPLGPAVPF